MENQLSTVVSTSRKWQNAAGVLLVSSMVLSLVSSFVLEQFKPFNSWQIVFLWMSYIPWFAKLLRLVSWIILYQLAVNKPTKVALLFIIFFWASGMVPGILNYIGYSSEFELITRDTIGLSYTIDYYSSLILIYSYSLIIRNNSLEKEDRSWIHIFMICIIGNAFFVFSSLMAGLANLWDSLPSTLDYWSSSFGSTCLGWVINILYIVAYWRFAHCAAFDKARAAESPAEYSYSPLNKFVIGMLVALALMSGVFYLLFVNVESIINFTESVF